MRRTSRRCVITSYSIHYTKLYDPHPAVQRVVEEGDEPRNTLAVEVTEQETTFLVNGTEVHRMPTSEAQPHGVVGIRANHLV